MQQPHDIVNDLRSHIYDTNRMFRFVCPWINSHNKFFAIAKDLTGLTKHKLKASDNFFIFIHSPISFWHTFTETKLKIIILPTKRYRRDSTGRFQIHTKLKSWKGHSHEEFHSAVLSDKFISELKRKKKVKVSRLKYVNKYFLNPWKYHWEINLD